MSCLENATQLYGMIGQGQSVEAFEKYYADNCVIIEPNGEVREGKEAQRKAIQQWFQMVEQNHGGGVNSITANEETGVACVECWMDITIQGHRSKMEEVAVQQWENGQITRERFYYNVPPQMENPQG